MSGVLEKTRTALDGWLDPILMKELRATFRGWKFFGVHTGFLALLSVALVVVILSMSTAVRWQPASVGRTVHAVFLGGMALAILLVLPSFASTSIVGEREVKTFEMLQTTQLSAAGVVRGKFLASMVYTAVFLFSSLPVGAIAFLYGGIGVGNLVASYACLLAVSAISNIFSIFISAHSRTSRTALASTGAFGIVCLVGLAGYLAALPSEALSRKAMNLIGLQALAFRPFPTADPPATDALLYLFALPLFVMGSIFAFSALSASNRIKPRAGNRSTNLKLFFLAFMILGSALWLLLLFRADFGPPWSRWRAAATFLGAFGIVATLSSSFAAEDPLHALPARLRGGTRFSPLRCLRPGAQNGFFFCLLLAILAATPALLLLRTYMQSAGVSFVPALVGMGLTILSFLLLSASAGLLLTTLILNERARMVVQSGIVTALIFLPLIAFAARHRLEKISEVSLLEPGLLSPAVAFGSLTTGFFEYITDEQIWRGESAFPYSAALGEVRLPAFLLTVGIHLALGLALWIAAERRLARAAKQAPPPAGDPPPPAGDPPPEPDALAAAEWCRGHG